MKCTLNKQEQHCDHSRWHTGAFIFSSVSHFHSHHQRSSPCLWNVLSSNLLKFQAFLLIICISGCFCYNGSQKRPLPEPSYGTLLTSILSPVHPHQCLNIWIIKSAFFSIILVFFVSSVIFQRWTSEAVQISSYLWCLKWKVHRPLRYHN